MDKKIFESFRDIIYEKSGIALGDKKDALVSSRVSKRMRSLGIDTYEEYLEYLLHDTSGNEIVQLLDVISTNVTSFFRESMHFDLLNELMREWASQGQRRFRIWSAASSTGEEPYSIAITLHEALDVTRHDIRILSTDISTRVLEHCDRGEYASDKIEPIPVPLRKRYFDEVDSHKESAYRVKPVIRKMVVFKRLNLSTPPFPMQGPLDVVFCRNVMIYFDSVVRKKLLAEIFRLLKPGGYLMVGHAESLTGLSTDFQVIRPSVYKKP